MVSSIVLGNFFNVTDINGNTRGVFGGAGGSGLNTEALVNGLVAARAGPIIQIEDQLSRISERASALNQFQQLLSSFQSAADALRNPPGVNNFSNNAFAYTSATVVSNTSVAANTYMTVDAAPGATPQNLNVTYITSLAAATKQLTGDFAIADADTAGLVVASGAVAHQFNAGTFTLKGQSITLTTTDTLNSIAAKFNAVSGSTNIRATVIKVSDGHYELSFTAKKTGTTNGFDLADSGTVTDASNVITNIVSGASGFTTPQAAANAVFKLDGVTITRSSNDISDVVEGLTFHLKQKIAEDPLDPPATPTSLLISVTSDTSIAQQAITSFANAYNSIQAFAAQQLQTNGDGTFADTAVLHSNQTFLQALNSITTQMGSKVSGVGSTFNNLADIGLTFDTQPKSQNSPEVKNVLNIDSNKLASVLQTDFDKIANLFQFTLTADNTNLRVFESPKPLGVSAFTVAINQFATQTTGNITVADADTAGVVVNASPTDGQFLAGTVTINGQAITLTDTDTLNTIAAKFQAVAATTGLSAAVSSTGAGTFKLTFTAVPQSGKVNKFSLESTTVDPTGVFDELGLTSTGTYTATYGVTTVDLTATVTAGSNAVLLAAPSSSSLSGLELIYGSDAAATITITTTEGLGHTLYNTADDTAAVDGTIDTEIASLSDRDTKLRAQVADINKQITEYRDQLLLKFGALEQAISRVNLLLQSLNAQQLAQQAAANN